MKEEDLTREVIAASVALAFRDYLSLMHLASENVSECLQKSFEIKESLLFLLYLALYLEEARGALRLGYGSDQLSPEDDPLVVLPLLRPLVDSLAFFALAEEKSDLKVDLLLGADEIKDLLTEDALLFLSKWGEETAKKTLATLGVRDD